MTEASFGSAEMFESAYGGEHTAERGYDVYVNDLGVELRPGDRVLDVGGSAGTFARETWQRSNGTVVVDSLDLFTNQDVEEGRIHFVRNTEDQSEIKYWPYQRITGDITQGVNIADNSYDHVVSHSAVPTWIEASQRQTAAERTASAIGEMLRVCKEGGDIRLFPMYVSNRGDLSGFGDPILFNHVQRVVQNLGHGFRLESVPEENGQLVENAFRIVIEKTSSNLPTLKDFQRLALVDRLVIALKEFARS